MMTKIFISRWLPYLAITLVYAIGAVIDIMEIDAAQYASISLEMLRSGQWLEVFDRQQDYLDKPPLLFWLSALSFKIFGVGNWQYKLPSILFSLLGIFSTYKLGERLYGARVGRHASMIFGSSLAMIVINNDVKTDTILVSSIVFSIWMLISAIQTNRWTYFTGSAVGIAIAMLTKGPIGLMMPLLAIGGHIILKREWRILLNPRWFFMFGLVAVALVPMCIGLYRQHGTEGLRFYFWTQSFGRITGESKWQNDASPFYFFHEFAWSYLPWTFLGAAGVIKAFSNIRSAIRNDHSELYLISGITLVWIALSFSRFKLPHYIFVVYPLIAILAANYLEGLNRFSKWAWVQLLISLISTALLVFILLYSFPNGGWIVSIIIFLLAAGAIVLFFNIYRSAQVIWPSFIMSMAIGLGLNLHFYPELLSYQANSQVGKWVTEHQIGEDRLIGHGTGGRALDFYAGRTVPWKMDAISTIEKIKPGMIVYARQELRDDLIASGYVPEKELVFENFPVQNLNIEFLDPRTRNGTLRLNYLMFY